MGFGESQAREALTACGSLERAIDFLLGGDCTVIGHQNSMQPDNAPRGSESPRCAVHCDVSQYSEPLGRSACTPIALTLAYNFLKNATTGASSEIDALFLSASIREGISVYADLSSISTSGVEHSSVEELLNLCSSSTDAGTCKGIVSSLRLLPSSPRQGILSNSSDNPMGLETTLSQCQADATDSQSHIAVVVTKPPETVLVILPPRRMQQQQQQGGDSGQFILIDSHPRPQQLSPHFPSGSYALSHSSLIGLVGSIKQIFPVTELGSDVPEMMSVMYNSFDVYPFQYRKHE